MHMAFVLWFTEQNTTESDRHIIDGYKCLCGFRGGACASITVWNLHLNPHPGVQFCLVWLWTWSLAMLHLLLFFFLIPWVTQSDHVSSRVQTEVYTKKWHFCYFPSCKKPNREMIISTELSGGGNRAAVQKWKNLMWRCKAKKKVQ